MVAKKVDSRGSAHQFFEQTLLGKEGASLSSS